jgi:REP element-mobilizing transposase RayT
VQFFSKTEKNTWLIVVLKTTYTLYFQQKNREPLIVPEIEARLHSYIIGISKERKVFILKINGTQDHVHILLKLHPSIALATLIKEYKAYSSGWMKKCGYSQFAWQEGYGGFSCSKSMLEPVIRYILISRENCN